MKFPHDEVRRQIEEARRSGRKGTHPIKVECSGEWPPPAAALFAAIQTVNHCHFCGAKPGTLMLTGASAEQSAEGGRFVFRFDYDRHPWNGLCPAYYIYAETDFGALFGVAPDSYSVARAEHAEWVRREEAARLRLN